MKLVYTIIFFLGMFFICWLAYGIFDGLDKGLSIWHQSILVIALGAMIFAMALFIRHYLRQKSGPNDK